ncbi:MULTISPECIES: xanthine dehydrogenase family protein molybdopterin-binding subunit [unclassified Streptosporangium]|uniref:xanthine dehydrogenase family protein molybdopterin-binding subunit n=1 Tax=unclassified Streptosporangium TaxID=2632669 RepID=UPI002E282963|nr:MULTISPECIES: xanthine dehydrogenase family protein molybdopterin-binding subunit [unclassified Streptosporangium]
MDRIDARAKVTGTAKYSSDHNLPEMAYGYMVTSTIGKGQITSMDLSMARAAGGVIEIYTPDNRLSFPGTMPALGGVFAETRHPFADREVHYYGQVVALVVGETIEQARDAAALIKVTYVAQPPKSSFEDAKQNPADPPSIPGLPLGEVIEKPVGVDIEAALAASEIRVEETYDVPPRHHMMMEPHAAVAAWQAGKLTIFSGTQGPAAHALEVATVLGVQPADVHVVSPYVGGAFGGKAFTWAPTLLAAAASRALGRPVKVVTSREQLFTVTGHRAASSQTFGLGADRDGRLKAIKHHTTSQSLVEDPGYRTTAKFYATPNVHIKLSITPDMNLPAATIMRAPGDEAGSFALESAMDELAVALGMDPIELRMTNYLQGTLIEGKPYSSKHLDECYQVGAERFGWSRRRAQPGTVIDGDWRIGMGMSTAILDSGRAPTAVRVTFRPNGTATVACATSDAGTGMWTIMALIGAGALNIPVNRIKPALGDSRLPLVGSNDMYGAVGSAATSTVTPAILVAAQEAVDELVQHATTAEGSPLFGAAGVRYDGGHLVGAGTSVDFGELLTRTRTSEVGAQGTTAAADDSHAYASYAAHFCEVKVNRWTGEPRLYRFTTVVDAGAILNAKTARNQITGGVLFGLAAAMFEEGKVEGATGRISNANFADYVLPVNADTVPIDVHFLDYPDTRLSPTGARGIGELGTVGAAAAFANAVYNATGKRIRTLPITPDKLLT